MSKTKKSLTAVREFLNSIESINHGGCGVSAITMFLCDGNSQELAENKFVLCFEECDKESYETNLDLINNTDEDGMIDGTPRVPCHIFYKKGNK